MIPPPCFIHEKDKIIPDSKGDGPLQSMLSIRRIKLYFKDFFIMVYFK